LKIAFWALFLSGFLLLAGCSGMHNKITQGFLSPSPTQPIQELTLLPTDRANMGVRVSPGPYPLPEIQTGDLSRSTQEAELKFCFIGQMMLDGSEPPTIDTPGSAFVLLRKEREAGSSEMQEKGSILLESPPGKDNEEVNSLVAVEPPSSEALPLKETDPLEESFERMKDILTQYEMESISPSSSSLEIGLDGKLPEGETRTNGISASFPKLLNDRVEVYIDLFQNKADHFFTKSLARSQAYEGIIRPILREKNLPEELLYLALIESGYDPHAQSRAKATGIWQFMKGTAKRFGLRVDQWVDERRDPEKSTLAAADYLKSLYEMFNCWFLAAAGYNAGEAKILQAMKRANSQDFWAISRHRYLKRETKEYVPKLLAAITIAQDPSKYGFSNIDYHPPLVYEKVVVPSGVRLDRIARAAETTVEEVRALNPALRRDKIPPNDPSFEIKLPPGKKEAFEKNFSLVFKLDPRTARKHVVRQGETLGQIAKKYKVDLRELCEGNGISPKSLIKPGMILLLPPQGS
jgi:LysM repeat protein